MTTKEKAQLAADEVINSSKDTQQMFTGDGDQPPVYDIEGFVGEIIDEWYEDHDREPSLKELKNIAFEIF